MKLDTFFEKFELFADAPDAVAKMRHLVLQMAVQGRLVEQNRNGESASDLLVEIARSGGSIFNCATYQPTDAPLPMLPENWCWAPTAILCDLQTGKRMKGGAQETGVVSLGGEHLKVDGTIDFTVPRYVSRSFYDEMNTGKVELDDTLMVKDGATTGKTAFVESLPEDGRAAINEHVFILRWHKGIEKKLGFYFIRALAGNHIATKSAGLIGGIRRDAVLDFPFPIPPVSEQKRIVAKVDELMALCDRLETQRQERETQHAALSRAALARFAEAPIPANLEFLFHKCYAIPPADLRKSILTLAVQGKLVPQASRDKPAEQTIRIARAKAGLPLENPSRRSDPPPFALPAGWVG